jgi:hypothetical protein
VYAGDDAALIEVVGRLRRRRIPQPPIALVPQARRWCAVSTGTSSRGAGGDQHSPQAKQEIETTAVVLSGNRDAQADAGDETETEGSARELIQDSLDSDRVILRTNLRLYIRAGWHVVIGWQWFLDFTSEAEALTPSCLGAKADTAGREEQIVALRLRRHTPLLKSGECWALPRPAPGKQNLSTVPWK